MLTIYFGNSSKERDKYEQFLCAHQIKYHKRLADKMGRRQLMALLAQTPDCFEILSPALLKYKRSRSFHFNQLLDLILVRPSRYLRLPIVIANDKQVPTIIHRGSFIIFKTSKNIFAFGL